MRLTDHELALAKIALAKRRPPPMTKEDAVLLAKYPRHSLAQAREIEGTDCRFSGGSRDSFGLIRLQETGNAMHLGGNHT